MGRIGKRRSSDLYLLIVTPSGYGKRVPVDEFKIRTRGTKGTSAIPIGSESAGACVVGPGQDVMIVTRKGMVLRLSSEEVTVVSRSARGSRLIRLGEDDEVIQVVPV